MEEIKTTAIVLSSIEYKEQDKLLNMFSVDMGKIFASIKSVKLPKSKLKVYAQPFCLAEYVLVKNKDYYKVINASLIDDFGQIVTDLDKFYVGHLILELVNYVVKPELVHKQLFINVIKLLRNLCYEDYSPLLIANKFILLMLSMLGEGLDFSRCTSCKCKFISNVFLSMDGGLVCKNCASVNSIELTRAEFNTLKLIDMTDIDGLKNINIKETILIASLNKLRQYFEGRFDYKIKSLKNIDR